MALRYFHGTFSPLSLTLSLLVHSPQSPSIFFSQTPLCPTRYIQKRRYKNFPILGALRVEFCSDTNPFFDIYHIC